VSRRPAGAAKRGRAELAALVLEQFRKAWPSQPRYPTSEVCENIAATALVNERLDRAPSLPAPSAELGNAGRYANLFLKHLPAARAYIRGEAAAMEKVAETISAGARVFAAHVPGVNDFDPLYEERARLAALLAALDSAQAAAKALMGVEKPQRERFEAERFIADIACAGWCDTDCRVSLSVKVERNGATDELTMSPLVQFVQGVLCASGHHSSPATIGEALRGRGNRQRRGGHKALQKVPH
jgi:hypothetical protein